MKKALFTGLMMLIALFAQSQLTPIAIDQLVLEAELIVEGEVIAKQSYWDDNGHNIYTVNTIELSQLFKGAMTATQIDLVTPGGTVGLDRHEFSHSAQVEIGEKGLFMIEASPYAISASPNAYRTIAGPQGKFSYELKFGTAHNVFSHFTDIEAELYPAIEQLTGSARTTLQEMDLKPEANESPKTITSFSPTTANAGIGEVLTITGSGFGASAGTVLFSNADDGGASFTPALATEIISWTDTEIQVEVNNSAGTGPIQVQGASTFTSSSSLTVPYAIGNIESDALVTGTFEAYRAQHVDDNSSGGYTWQMFTDFANDANASASFIRAFDSWVETTCINWDLGANTTVDAIASDGVNVVRFDNGTELQAGILGTCVSRYSGCFVGGSINWYITEMDIYFDDTQNWNYGPAAPAFSEYDFESVAVHELGHGHQLVHVINSSEVMHYALSNGIQKRNISTNEEAGALNVMNRSTTTTVCGEGSMTDHSSCAAVCNEADVPTVTPSSSTVCPGTDVTLTITGDLNDATAWHVYTGSCGGTQIGSTSSSSIVVSPANGSTTYFVRGEGGCTTPAACGSAAVTAEDNVQPILSCPGDQSLDFNSSCQASLLDYTASASYSDNCTSTGSLSVSQSPPMGTTITSATLVSITVTDASGNSASCSFTVTPTDTTVPNISCPGDQTENFNASCEFTMPNYASLATVSDNCTASPNVTQSPSMGATITGATTVTLTAIDDEGNSSNCSFQVIPNDAIAPSITCPSDITVSVDPGTCSAIADYGSPVATDNCGTPTVTLLSGLPAGDTFPFGPTPNTFRAIDAAGNSALCTVTVDVVDDELPTISCPGDQTLTGDALCQAVLPDYRSMATVADNCTSSLALTQSPAPNTIIFGAPTVTVSATDDSGNSASCQFVVTVQGDASFSYSASEYCPDDADPTPIVTGVAGGTFSGTPGLVVDPANGTIDVIGSSAGAHVVTYTLAGGCSGSSTQNVTILTSAACQGGPGTIAECVAAMPITTAVLGQPNWQTFPLDNEASVIGCSGNADDDRWFSFTAQSANDLIIAQDPSASYNTVIELYDACETEAALACYDNYPAGQMERVVPGNLTVGQTYYFRAYDAAAASPTSMDVRVQVKTYEDGGLQSSYCGGTDYTLNQSVYAENDALGQLYANPGIPVKAYEFMFEQSGGGTTIIAAHPNELPYLTLSAAQGLEYGETYDVSVRHRVKMNSNGQLEEHWSGFGTACPITLASALPTTALKPSDCGRTDLFLNDNIQATPLAGAEMYRFTFNGGGETFVKTVPTYGLLLYSVTNGGAGLSYGVTYDVGVEAMVAGEWSATGAICTIGMSSQPQATRVAQAYCGATYVSPAPNFIVANLVYGASAYQFRFSPMSGGADIIITRPGVSLTFHTIGMPLSPGTYAVDVRAFAGGQWGDYGTPCDIDITGTGMDQEFALVKQQLNQDKGVDLSLWPNPTHGELTLELSDFGAYTGRVEVEVLDLSGRLVLTRTWPARGEHFTFLFEEVSGLEQGNYMLRVRLGDRSTQSIFIKN